MSYQLQQPFKARQGGADVEYTELSIPDIVTVGMMRQVSPGNTLLRAHALTEVCAGLGPFEAAKLATADAMGYVAAIGELLTPHDEPGFALPEIKPVRALMAKITAEPTEQVEFAAQVLQHSGMARSEIDAMDVRAFIPAARLVAQAVASPKK